MLVAMINRWIERHAWVSILPPKFEPYRDRLVVGQHLDRVAIDDSDHLAAEFFDNLWWGNIFGRLRAQETLRAAMALLSAKEVKRKSFVGKRQCRLYSRIFTQVKRVVPCLFWTEVKMGSNRSCLVLETSRVSKMLCPRVCRGVRSHLREARGEVACTRLRVHTFPGLTRFAGEW